MTTKGELGNRSQTDEKLCLKRSGHDEIQTTGKLYDSLLMLKLQEENYNIMY